MIQWSYSRSTTFTYCVRVKMIAGNTRDNMYRAEGGGGCQENGGTCSDSHSLMYHRRNISCASNKFTYKFGQTVHQCLTAPLDITSFGWKTPQIPSGSLVYSQTRVTTTPEPLSLGWSSCHSLVKPTWLAWLSCHQKAMHATLYFPVDLSQPRSSVVRAPA